LISLNLTKVALTFHTREVFMNLLRINVGNTKKSLDRGLTLIELVIVLAIIGIFTAVMVFAFNAHKAKGELLLTAAQGLGSAAKRFELDTGCYPTNVEVLFDSPMAATTTANTCGSSLTGTWAGPYMQIRPVTSNGNMMVAQIAPKVELGFEQLNGGTAITNGGAEPYQYAVKVVGVPGGVARQFMIACSGNGSSTSAQTSMCANETGGSASESAVAGSFGATGNSLVYMFAESNEPYCSGGSCTGPSTSN
jgi:prepilin-type N-terminal cleavage/methylation domain-containing protein